RGAGGSPCRSRPDPPLRRSPAAAPPVVSPPSRASWSTVEVVVTRPAGPAQVPVPLLRMRRAPAAVTPEGWGGGTPPGSPPATSPARAPPPPPQGRSPARP